MFFVSIFNLLLCVVFFLTLSIFSIEIYKNLAINYFPNTRVYITPLTYKCITTAAGYCAVVLSMLIALLICFRAKFINFLEFFFQDLKPSYVSFKKQFPQDLQNFILDTKPFHLIVFCIILLFGIYLRVIFISLPLTADESMTFLRYVNKPLLEGPLYYHNVNNHILHSIFAYLINLLFGHKLYLLRIPALIAGILLIPISYLASRIIYDKYSALLLASLISFSSILIEYSTLARGYTLSCMFFMLALLVAVYKLNKDSVFLSFLFSIIVSLGIYTQPLFVIPFGIITCWQIISEVSITSFKRSKKNFYYLFTDIFFVCWLTILFYLPTLLLSLVPVLKKILIFLMFLGSWGHNLPAPSKEVVSNSPNIIDPLNILFEVLFRDLNISFIAVLALGFLISLILNKKISNYISIPLISLLITIPLIFFPELLQIRFFLFHLLIFYLGSSAAILFLFIKLIQQLNFPKEIMSNLFILILSTILFINILANKASIITSSVERFNGVENLVIYLKKHIKANDTVFSTQEDIIRHYFFIHQIPSSFIAQDLDNRLKGSLFILINKNSGGSSLDKILKYKKINLEWKKAHNIETVKSCSSAILVRVSKKQ